MLVSLLIVTLLLAVLQVAVYVHVRNVVTASAQEGARYAANADVPSDQGAAQTVQIVARRQLYGHTTGVGASSSRKVARPTWSISPVCSQSCLPAFS